MNTMTNKGITYICYGKNDGTFIYGSFDDVPMDAYIGIINLKMPTIDEYGNIKYNEYIHRIFCGDDIPAETFLKAYKNEISPEKQAEINNKIAKGFKTVVVPFGTSIEFTFLTENDRLCSSRGEFEDLITEFKEKNEDILDFITPTEEERRNKM